MNVTSKEQEYIYRYRQLDLKKDEVNLAVAKLKQVCESLKDWPTIAARFGDPGWDTSLPQWSDDSLNNLSRLRSLLSEFHQMAQILNRLWSELRMEERKGLAEPSSIRPA